MIIEKSKWEKCPACKQSHKIALALQERVTKLEAEVNRLTGQLGLAVDALREISDGKNIIGWGPCAYIANNAIKALRDKEK